MVALDEDVAPIGVVAVAHVDPFPVVGGVGGLRVHVVESVHRGAGAVIVRDMGRGPAGQVLAVLREDYRDIGDDIAIVEFRYQGSWEKERRMVVVREPIKEGKEGKKEPKLFELQGYSYQVIVTNIEGWEPEKVWRFYNKRACVENMIKEGIMGYGLDVTISHCYGANVAHFRLKNAGEGHVSKEAGSQ